MVVEPQNFRWIYDSLIKAGSKAKIRPSSILIYNFSKTKKAKEMIVTPKENILIYFHLRQKKFVLCTHKAHFCRLKIFFRFLLKIAYFHQQNRGVSKIVCASTWHKKNILKYTSWVYLKSFYIINSAKSYNCASKKGESMKLSKCAYSVPNMFFGNKNFIRW